MLRSHACKGFICLSHTHAIVNSTVFFSLLNRIKYLNKKIEIKNLINLIKIISKIVDV